MKNPLRSEAEAYRFLLGTIVYFGAIVLAAVVGGTWWGVGVFVVLSVLALIWFFQRDDLPPPPKTGPRQQSAEDEKRILVVANETVGGQKLRDIIRERSEGVREEVLVVAPALNSPLRTWTSDEDAARATAQERLDASLARLREAGINARGEVGDGDPLQAIEDALRTFGADELIVLDASGGPVELARARRRRRRPRPFHRPDHTRRRRPGPRERGRPLAPHRCQAPLRLLEGCRGFRSGDSRTNRAGEDEVAKSLLRTFARWREHVEQAIQPHEIVRRAKTDGGGIAAPRPVLGRRGAGRLGPG